MPFDQLVRITFDEHAVLERGGLAFVGVDHEVARQHAFGKERPLQTGGEVRAAPARAAPTS